MTSRILIGIVLCLLAVSSVPAQESSQILPNPHGFEMKLWAREPMLKNPVALSFDDKGRLFVVETARRGTVDIDIRSHKDWAFDDLKNQSVAQLRLFFRDKMSPKKSEENATWLEDRNQDGSHDWRDLMALKERVYRIADTDGDRIADESKIFYEGFNEEFNGVIAGVMPWKNDVWVTVYPDLWHFKDVDQDGIADPQHSKIRGFGVHAAYDGHDIHGLTVGPEGKLYFSVGDNGFSVVTLEGKRLHHPNTGGVLRMNPDGSDLEVFAYGLRNVQEIAFDDYGNLFSVDNDGDIEDERERFVYIVEGSDSGWRLNWQFRNQGWTRSMDQPLYNPWIHEKMWIPHFNGQPAHITPPLSNYSVGPGGFKYNPGAALNESYRGYFFLAQFPVQKITAFRAKPKGAYFEMENEHVFHFGLMASAMNFGPDGAMYIADWDGKWQPNEKGAIHRLDDPSVTDSPLRREVEQLLSEGFEDRYLNELAQLLGHIDQRIRQRAQGALAAKSAGELLLRIARTTSRPELARIHALWGLIEMRADGLQGLDQQLPFQDPNPEIRAQTAKLAGDLRLRKSAPLLQRLLTEVAHPRVQFHAAVALGKIQARESVPALISLLKTNGGKDPYLRHAAIMGLAGSASPSQLLQLKDAPSVAVQIGAINALRRLGSDLVAGFLGANQHILVLKEAVRAIHDDFSIPRALPRLAEMLDLIDLPQDEAVIRRVISANLRLGGAEHGKRLLRFALDEDRPSSMRQEAVESLRVWNQRPYLDRVEGRARNLGPRDPNLGDRLIQDNAMALLSSADSKLTATITQAIRRNGLEVPSEVLENWLRDPEQDSSIRVDALSLLNKKAPSKISAAIEVAMSSEIVPLRLAALKIEADSNEGAYFSRHEGINSYSISEQQLLVGLLEGKTDPRATALLLDYLAAFSSGNLAAELALDVVTVAKQQTNQSIRSAWTKIVNAATPKVESTDYRFSLRGGTVKNGKQVYESHIAAQCVRCHNAGGTGKQVGPVLDGIGSRVDRDYLLQAILEPSLVIAPGYQTISVELNDGETYDGVVVSENESELVLGLPIGGTMEIDKAQIHSRSASQVSAMPSMKDIMTPQEVRDLIAYLASL
jgi:quinoprotein glucose dehydrogenase